MISRRSVFSVIAGAAALFAGFHKTETLALSMATIESYSGSFKETELTILYGSLRPRPEWSAHG